jgi:hypothetical protein
MIALLTRHQPNSRLGLLTLISMKRRHSPLLWSRAARATSSADSCRHVHRLPIDTQFRGTLAPGRARAGKSWSWLPIWAMPACSSRRGGTGLPVRIARVFSRSHPIYSLPSTGTSGALLSRFYIILSSRSSPAANADTKRPLFGSAHTGIISRRSPPPNFWAESNVSHCRGLDTKCE